MDQNLFSQHNRTAWDAAAYDAWVLRYGEPAVAGANVRADPRHTLRRILPFLGDPSGMKVANPLGSHGRIATALSLLGARVNVFDISASNARYARELSAAAGTSINYIVGDFLEKSASFKDAFDATVMELGIVHYFLSLEYFTEALKVITKQSGTVVLVDFHPPFEEINFDFRRRNCSQR